jgi:hypothetical protein
VTFTRATGGVNGRNFVGAQCAIEDFYLINRSCEIEPVVSSTDRE